MIKIYLLISILSVTITCAQSQETTCDTVYNVAMQMPMFGSNSDDFSKYFSEKVTYKCKPIGKIVLMWTVDKEGKMIDINATGIEGECKTDVINQIKKFPNWNPGKQNNVPVCVKMSLASYIHWD